MELLKPAEFRTHIDNRTLRLSFVGMSNAGKSYRSRLLSTHMDFLWYQVDEEIQKALKLENMEAISAWLGYPSQESYKEREARYLALENKFTSQAAMHSPGKNLVFDTTGSVAHLLEETLAILKQNCLVVHLDVGEDLLHEMVENFFLKPKPVCWGEYFAPISGESSDDTLRRCYPTLLESRLKNYRTLAHINIPAKNLFDRSAEETLAIIEQYL